MKSRPYPSAKFRGICTFVNDTVCSFINAKKGCSAELVVYGRFQSDIIGVVEVQRVPPAFGAEEKFVVFLR
jgi:hypothetical protein